MDQNDMPSELEILKEVGLSVSVREGVLYVTPGEKLTPELTEMIRSNKEKIKEQFAQSQVENAKVIAEFEEEAQTVRQSISIVAATEVRLSRWLDAFDQIVQDCRERVLKGNAGTIESTREVLKQVGINWNAILSNHHRINGGYRGVQGQQRTTEED